MKKLQDKILQIKEFSIMLAKENLRYFFNLYFLLINLNNK